MSPSLLQIEGGPGLPGNWHVMTWFHLTLLSVVKLQDVDAIICLHKLTPRSFKYERPAYVSHHA